jgi:hypothetical protein
MAKDENKAVIQAYKGPEVEHDDLITEIEARAREQHERSSDASESAAKVSAFIDKTGLNTQAYSWASSIVKKLPKKDGQAKAMDIIRSLETMLPMVKAHVSGQSTSEMDFGAPAESNEAYGKPKPPVTAPSKPKPKPKAKPEPEAVADDEPEDAERSEFDAQVDSVVTPINFGGGARH